MSVVPGFAHKAFIPYTNAFHASPPNSASVVHGVASEILPDKVVLANGESIPYEYLVIATGTGFPPLQPRFKAEAVEFYAKSLQERVKESSNICVIGGGASGVREFPHRAFQM
jgi:NADH dehydrogenase FAD-containing subunit